MPTFHEKPNFIAKKKDGECGDGILDLGTDLVLMEFKASLLTLRAKYLADWSILKPDLDDKFNKQDDGRKGVQQIANVLKKLLAHKKPDIKGFDLKNYKRVIPVVVVYDPGVSAPAIDGYLDKEFRQAIEPLDEGSPKIERLIVITTREVECLEALSMKHDLRDVFGGYLRQSNPLLSFYDYLCLQYQGDMQHPETLLSQSITEGFRETGEMFFGKKASGS